MVHWARARLRAVLPTSHMNSGMSGPVTARATADKPKNHGHSPALGNKLAAVPPTVPAQPMNCTGKALSVESDPSGTR